MVFEDVLKIVGAAVAIATSMFTLWQLAKNDRQGKWGRMREEYKFAKEFLVELQTTPVMSDFQKAKGYQAISGFQGMGVKEGDYLMSLKEPARAMDRYVLGFDYVEHNPARETEQIQLLKKYQPKLARNWRKAFYIATYAMCVFFAVAPLLTARFFGTQWGVLAMSVVTCLIVFIPGAWVSLQSLAKIIAAERLVNNQVLASSEPARSI